MKSLGSDGAWDVSVYGKVQKLASELVRRAHSEDLVKRPWLLQPDGVVTVWTDASSIAMGVAIQVNETLVEVSLTVSTLILRSFRLLAGKSVLQFSGVFIASL